MPLAKEYLLLFNALTDTEEALARLRTELLLVQQQAEGAIKTRPLSCFSLILV